MNWLFFLYLLTLSPKIIFPRNRYLLKKLFGAPPLPTKPATIWIHAVSVGEVKAAEPLFRALLGRYPNHFFLITTTTATGQAEALNTLAGADCYSFLPFDFSWRVRKWVQTLNLKFLFLIETDLWPNLLSEVRKGGGKTILVSGKMSLTSWKRFSWFPKWSKKLLSRIDLFCLQNEEHKKRFACFVDNPKKLEVTGNLKFNQRPVPVDKTAWQEKLQIPEKSVVFASTHAPEEELLVSIFPWDECFLTIAPRHPQRFEEVARLLSRKKIPFLRWSTMEERRGDEKILLLDAMGQLPIIYSLSALAIMGGSYTKKVGGHNILEPILYKAPVFFGPHMFQQSELASYVLQAGVGKQVLFPHLRSSILSFFSHPEERLSMQKNIQLLANRQRNAAAKTLTAIEQYEKNLNINS